VHQVDEGHHNVRRQAHDYRRYKYELSLPEKQRDVDDRTRDSDERFTEFQVRHPYMNEEELEMYHKHHDVEPFFHSRAEKAEWKQS